MVTSKMLMASVVVLVLLIAPVHRCQPVPYWIRRESRHKFFDNREYDDGYEELTAAEKNRMLTLQEILMEDQGKQLEDDDFTAKLQRSNILSGHREDNFEQAETDRELDQEVRTEGKSELEDSRGALTSDELALKREEQKMEKESGQESLDFPEVGELFEEDIVMDKRLRNWVTGGFSKRDAVISDDVKWPNKELPYVISDDIPEGTLKWNNIQRAIQDFHDYSCIRLREKRPDDKDYVNFIGHKKNQCYSNVGRSGGEQIISIGDGCERLGTVQHEILHATGFIHEQSRPDRDKFVEVLKQNIKPNMLRNFDKYPRYMVDDMNVGYDFDSVLHYNNKAFSSNGEDTLVDKQDTSRTFGQREMFSKKDIRQLNILYDCPKDEERERRISQLKYD